MAIVDKKKDRKNKKSKASIIIFSLLIIISLITGMLAIKEYMKLKEEKDKFSQLLDSVDSKNAQEDKLTPSEDKDEVRPMPQYKDLFEKNSEMYGWISIEGTEVNYPVMYTPSEPEKYLNRDFNGDESISGSIFLDYRCAEGCDNEILYGHNMKNKSMFGSILNYENPKFLKEHPIIHFDTLYESRDYEVLYVFYDKVYEKKDESFKYYNVINLNNEEEFAYTMDQYKNKSMHNIGAEVEYGDKFLTLSTCSYHIENGRFAVVAKRVK